MVKPSIFSKDYQKKMRIRRQKITIFVLIVMIAALIVFTYGKGYFNVLTQKINYKNIAGSDKKSNTVDKNSKKSEADNKKNSIPQNGSYDVALSSGEKIKAVYDIKDNQKIFKCIEPVSSKAIYSINNDGSRMVIYDKNNQNMILVDADGTLKSITKPDYTSTDGTMNIKKEDELKQNPEYIWCSSPVFVGKENIVYISQLPWFGRTQKYVWIYNAENNTHITVKDPNGNDLNGNDLKFNGVTDKGLSITSDNKNYILSYSGITQ